MFADFAGARRPRGGPDRDPDRRRATRSRANGPWSATAATGRPAWSAGSRPARSALPDAERQFETIWTADRETARSAARICCGLAPEHTGAIVERLAEPVVRSGDELRRAEALTARMIAYLAAA